MKLATALNERADIQTRLDQIKTRLAANAKVQEGDSPAEDPVELLAEMDGCISRLEELIARINRTNSVTRQGDMSISDMLARRDCLRLKHQMLRNFINQASDKVDRYSRAEIRVISTVDVRGLQKQADALAAELRGLDERIQELNWLTDLI